MKRKLTKGENQILNLIKNRLNQYSEDLVKTIRNRRKK